MAHSDTDTDAMTPDQRAEHARQLALAKYGGKPDAPLKGGGIGIEWIAGGMILLIMILGAWALYAFNEAAYAPVQVPENNFNVPRAR